MIDLNKTTARIYVACLSSYNAGKLHGDWIDITLGIDHINERIAAILAASSEEVAEEWAVHDYDCMGYDGGEYPDLEEIALLGELINDDEDKAERVIGLMKEGDYDKIEDAKQFHEDQYRGFFDSMADFAYYQADELVEISSMSDVIRYNIDWEGVGRALECDYTLIHSARKAGVHVYSNN